MGIRKVYQRLAVTARQYFGSAENVSQRYDSGAGQYVQRDETNGVDQVIIRNGNDLTDELEENGAMELVIGKLLNFDPKRVIVDTRANQPAAGTADRVMFVTDDQVLEYDDGAAWNELGASAAALKDGGASELDAADLSGADGNDGQVLTTNGAAASWASATGIGADDALAYDFVMN
jgi:hypothetical protein